MNLKMILPALAISVCCGIAAPANATPYNPITWSVTGTFDDSTTFSGSFSLNVDGYFTTPFSITTSNGDLTGAIYDISGIGAGGAIPGSGPPYFGFNAVLYPSTGQNPVETLQLVFQNSLETPGVDPIIGGIIVDGLVTGPSFECYAFSCPGADTGTGGPDTRFVFSGAATTPNLSGTPIPTALPLTATALGLGYLITRKRRPVVHQLPA